MQVNVVSGCYHVCLMSVLMCMTDLTEHLEFISLFRKPVVLVMALQRSFFQLCQSRCICSYLLKKDNVD